MIILLLFASIVILGICISKIIKQIVFRKECNKLFENEFNKTVEYSYLREIKLKDITPIEAGVLTGKGRIDINTIIIYIFQLEEKKTFNVVQNLGKYYIELSDNITSKMNSLTKEEQRIVKIIFKSSDDKSKYELSEIIDMIYKDLNKKIILDDIYFNIKKRIRDKYYVDPITFFKSYNPNFDKKIINPVSSEIGLLIMIILMSGFLLLSLIGINILSVFTSISACISLVMQFKIIVDFNSKWYIKKEYMDEVRKLNGLYNYINDFSTINDKELKYYELYNDYYLYAISMGIADKYEKEFVQKNIDNKISTNLKVLFNYKKGGKI